MTEPDFMLAASPLFESGEVETLEWSFDMGWGPDPLPLDCLDLLRRYSERDLLIGHGVSFSILSGHWTAQQEEWLRCFKEEVNYRNYRHISEHFGFMTAGNFHRSAPLPVPLTSETLELGKSRMQTLADLAGVPVGLENLALAFGPRDVLEQGEFLRQLVECVDGFLVLDLHNLYCQAHNFNLEAETLMATYPTDLVREVHVSGGSWSHPVSNQDQTIRRDTHDNAVPSEVFDLLESALQKCGNVEAVIFERLGNTLLDTEDIERYRADFRHIKSLVTESCNVTQ